MDVVSDLPTTLPTSDPSPAIARHGTLSVQGSSLGSGAPGPGPKTWDLTVQGPPQAWPTPDMFKRVHCEPCTVGKRTVRILLD